MWTKSVQLEAIGRLCPVGQTDPPKRAGSTLDAGSDETHGCGQCYVMRSPSDPCGSVPSWKPRRQWHQQGWQYLGSPWFEPPPGATCRQYSTCIPIRLFCIHISYIHLDTNIICCWMLLISSCIKSKMCFFPTTLVSHPLVVSIFNTWFVAETGDHGAKAGWWVSTGATLTTSLGSY